MRNKEVEARFLGEFRAWDNGPGRRTVVGTFSTDTQTFKGKGYVDEGEMTYGLTYRLFGHWKATKYGDQFEFNSFVQQIPATPEAIISYLKTAHGPRGGITDRIARLIYQEHGEHSIDMVINQPATVAQGITHWTPEKAELAAEFLRRNENVRKVRVELVSMLDGYRFPRKTIDRAIKRWGTSAADVIKSDEYELCKLPGCGFKSVDKFFLDRALHTYGSGEAYQAAVSVMRRQAMCATFDVRNTTNQTGSTWIPFAMATAAVSNSINRDYVKPREAVNVCCKLGTLDAYTEPNGQEWVALKREADKELEICEVLSTFTAEEESAWPEIHDLPNTLIPSQLSAAEKVTSSRISILCGGPGTGKAQVLDAKILTPTGWKLMGDMKVGDEVIGANGKPTQVTGVFPQGMKNVYRVTMSDGCFTECCDEHLWETTTHNDRKHGRRASIRNTLEILSTLKRTDGKSNHQIPLTKPVEFTSSVRPIDAYLLGLLLGDGGLTKGSVRITTPDEFIVGEIACLLPDGVVIRKLNHGPYDYALVKRSGNSGKRCNPLISVLRDLELYGKKSTQKHIPHAYLFGSVEDRIKMMQGLLDTDGYADRCNIEYSTSSTQLAEDFCFLVRSLGGLVSVSQRYPKYVHKGEKRTGQLSYRILVKLPSTIQPFRLPKKANRYIPRTKYQPTRRIESIEPIGRKECQCISVASDDGLYLTDDFIVTHNTFCVAALVESIIHQNGASSVAIACPTAKAAARVLEALGEYKIQGVWVGTVHSLLQVQRSEDGGAWTFTFGKTKALPYRFIIIDESSMLDTGLCADLLNAVSVDGHVLFVGDADQLPPVGIGKPFLDMQQIVPCGMLTEIRRNSGRIARECKRIREEQSIEFSPVLDEPNGENLPLFEVEENDIAETVEDIIASIGEQVDPVWDCQIITPCNEGAPFSRRELNRRFQQILNPNGEQVEGNPFRVGDKVICLRNGDYEVTGENARRVELPDGRSEPATTRVANGEMGRIESLEQSRMRIKLFFPEREVLVPFAKVTMPEEKGIQDQDEEDASKGLVGDWDLAYAISVHKSQGSQWKYVVFILDPTPKASRLMNRQLVYTGISRAQLATICVGSAQVARKALRKDGLYGRKTLLVERSRQMQAALTFAPIETSEPEKLDQVLVGDPFEFL